MAPTSRLIASFRSRVVLVAVAGVVLRLVYAYVARDTHGLMKGVPISGDGVDYHNAAIDLVNGRGFISRPTMKQYAGHPPLWVLVLVPGALITETSFVPHQVTAILVGGVAVLALGYLGRELGGDRCGVVTAVIAALYPGLWVYERLVLSEPLMFAFVAILLTLAYRLRLKEVTWVRVVAIGVVAGLAALTRSETIILVPLVLIPAILANREAPWSRRWRGVAVAVLCVLVVIAPWAAYNRTRFSTPVYLSYGLGITMAISNCDATFRGENIGFFDVECLKTMPLGDDDAALDGERASYALQYQLDHAERLPWVLAAREGRTWGFFRPSDQLTWESSAYGTPRWVGWLRLATYWLLVPFAVLGAWWRFRRRLWLYPLLVPVGMAAAITAVTYGESRYRAIAEISIVALAGFAISTISERYRRSSADAEPGGDTTDGTSAALGESSRVGAAPATH